MGYRFRLDEHLLNGLLQIKATAVPAKFKAQKPERI